MKRDEAKSERDEAKSERDEAERKRDEAERKRDEAEKKRNEAERKRDEAAKNLTEKLQNGSSEELKNLARSTFDSAQRVFDSAQLAVESVQGELIVLQKKLNALIEEEHTEKSNPTKASRESFEKLLVQGGLRPREDIMEKLLLLNARAVEHSRSHRQARFYYEWAKAVPSSITRGIFTDVTGFTLDGAHDHLLGFLFAFDKAGAVLMFKITPDSASEVEYAKALYGGPFLVPAAFHKAELEGHKVSGLLMPKYERSLAVDVFNLSLDILYSRAKTMEQAVAFIHSKGIVHMDIKPGNIFIDSAGNWYLGDFGSCTLEGSTILSTTEVYYPRRIIGTPSKFAYDWYMLCAAVVSKIKTWEYEDLDASVRGAIAECIHPQLKLCLETFMDRHDKGL